MPYALRTGQTLEVELVFLHPDGAARVCTGLDGIWSNHPFHSAHDETYRFTWEERPCDAGLEVRVTQTRQVGFGAVESTEQTLRSVDGGRTWSPAPG